MPQNEMVKRLVWMGFIAGIESLASIVAIRFALTIWRRIYGEDPPGYDR
ncbi:MAG: hypothetical protein F2796_00105 [Actinobacteria bacterium]|nr:hypothetical protein [Actinomycetota bacterium]